MSNKLKADNAANQLFTVLQASPAREIASPAAARGGRGERRGALPQAIASPSPKQAFLPLKQVGKNGSRGNRNAGAESNNVRNANENNVVSVVLQTYGRKFQRLAK